MNHFFGAMIFVLGFTALNLKAFGFTMTISNATYLNGGTAIVLDPLAAAIATQFNDSIAGQVQVSNFLEELGNANVGSSRSFLSPGVVDQASYLVALSGSMALALGSGASLSGGYQPKSNELPPIGVGAKNGVTVGVSGKVVHAPLPFNVRPERLLFTASFSMTDMSSFFKSPVSIKSTQYALGGSYLIYPPINWLPFLRWNGFRLSTGLSFSSFDVVYATPFNISQSGALSSTLTWASTIDIGASSWVISLPIEATTGIRLFWTWNIFMGLGLDFNYGQSQITGGGSGPITGTALGQTVYQATATIDGTSSSTAPNAVQLRYLIGTQIDLGPFGIYVQAQASLPSVYAVNAGANFMF